MYHLPFVSSLFLYWKLRTANSSSSMISRAVQIHFEWNFGFFFKVFSDSHTTSMHCKNLYTYIL